jgi:hypothetical protein
MKLDEIVSIKYVGKRKTIDIEVDGDHMFFCNGILTHNSAAGNSDDVTEENVQGGIAKIQAADNVLALIPNSQERDIGRLSMKLLKTRDSGGVGSVITFNTDWSTLSFNPMMNEKKFDKKGLGTPNLRKTNNSEDKDDSDKEKPKGGDTAALRKTGRINKKRALGKNIKLV